MLRHALAHPGLLYFLALLPVLGVLSFWSWRRRRHLLIRFGNPGALETVLTTRRAPWLRRVCLLLGLAGLGLGMAGPQWGRDWSQALAPGRDLIVAVDCSRSMLAETPSRLSRARAALLDLADALHRQGGHRVALVLFGARARLACPLTHDYDHFRELVENLESAPFDPRLQPGAKDVSGTRIGRGLAAALALLARDPRLQRRGAVDLLLLSDGADPAARDGEWQKGAQQAHDAGVPVYVIGIGDPDRDSPVWIDNSPLRYEGEEVQTHLVESLLRTIAERTRGRYIPAQTRTLPLGALYLDTIAQGPLSEDSEASLPVYRQRYAWLLLPAFGLLVLALALPERLRDARRGLAHFLIRPLRTPEEP